MVKYQDNQTILRIASVNANIKLLFYRLTLLVSNIVKHLGVMRSSSVERSNNLFVCIIFIRKCSAYLKIGLLLTNINISYNNSYQIARVSV